jgi:hypothetical protein
MSIQALNSLGKNSILPGIRKDNQFESEAVTGEDFSNSSKLTNVEAQRIMAVLQEIQKKFHIIGLLPDINDRKLATVLSGSIVPMVKELNQLELKYKSISGDETQGVIIY